MLELGWSEILAITLIGFSLVFTVLVILIYIIKLFGVVFTRNQKKRVATTQNTPVEEFKLPHMVGSEEAAAIAMAISLYTDVMHDHESEILTIQKVKRVYSPWNSKIYGFTQVPERNRK
jgi:sodium pump decarboxylase gamma subunit